MEITKELIINEIETVPKEKFKELFHFIEQIIPDNKKKQEDNRKKILSFAGMLRGLK